MIVRLSSGTPGRGTITKYNYLLNIVLQVIYVFYIHDYIHFIKSLGSFS